MTKNPKFPNLIILHAHDMGRYNSLHGFDLPTPHMRAFGERATLFRNCHCAAPTCSPSRAALLTGETAHQAGMLGLCHRGWDLMDRSRHLAHFLGQQGFHTVLSGIQHEFDLSRGESPYVEHLESDGDIFQLDISAAEASAAFLNRRAKDKTDQPFFLWTGFFMPHRKFPDADPDNARYLQPPAPLPDTPEVRQDMADYAAAVEIADKAFGTVMDALETSGLAENTMVILTTDHGIAFPLMKCNLTSHGTGVTFAIDYPGNPSKGQVNNALISQLDVFPTICDLLQLPKPDWLLGESMRPLIEDGAKSIREDIFAEVTYHAAYEPMRMVRTDRYVYIRRFEKDLRRVMANVDDGHARRLMLQRGFDKIKRQAIELYDTYFDPVESRNLVGDPTYAEVLAEMEERLQAWMKRTDDPILKGPIQMNEWGFANSREAMYPNEGPYDLPDGRTVDRIEAS